MANVAPYNSTPARGMHKAVWTLAEGDTGLPSVEPQHSDRAIQIEGTPGSGFAMVIEGSLDDVNYHTLTDPQGNDLSFTGVGSINQILQNVSRVRPRCTAGDGTTAVVVTLLSRGGFI